MHGQGDAAALFEEALSQAQSGQLLEGLRLVREAIALSERPEARLWGLLSLILSAQQLYEVALSLVETGLFCNPEDQTVLLKIKASLNQHLGRTDEAVRDLAQLQARTLPQGDGAWLEVGRLFLSLRQYQEAGHCIQQACKQSGWTPAAYCLQAQLHQAEQRWQTGMDCCNNALAIDPSNLAAIYTLSQLHLGRGRQQDTSVARALLSSITRKSSSRGEAWHQLGLIDKAQGQWQSAAECLQMSLACRQGQPILPWDVLKESPLT